MDPLIRLSLGGRRPSAAIPFICRRCAQPVRSKKTTRFSKNLTVRLLKDLPGYGKTGAVIPVPIGQMRNKFFPEKIAEYVSAVEQKELRRNHIPIERDVFFGREREALAAAEAAAGDSPESKIAAKSEPRTVELNELGASSAHELLETVIPPTLTYYRAAIASAAERRHAPSAPADPAKVAAPPVEETPRQSPDNIFGSVSAADIAGTIKGILHERGMAGLVILPDEEIEFVELGGPGSDARADRVKRLGEFAVEIRVRGWDEPIRRTVQVVPEDEKAEAEAAALDGADIGMPTRVVADQAESLGG